MQSFKNLPVLAMLVLFNGIIQHLILAKRDLADLRLIEEKDSQD